jgi:hypothetical protein
MDILYIPQVMFVGDLESTETKLLKKNITKQARKSERFVKGKIGSLK